MISKKTFKKQIFIALFATLIVNTIILTVLFVHLHYAKIIETADQEEKTLVRTFALGVRDLIVTYDYSSLDEFVKSLSENKRILYIVIGSRNNEIIAKYTSFTGFTEDMNNFIWKPIETDEISLTKRSIGDSTLDDIYYPLVIANKRWGWIRLGFDRSYLNMEILELVRNSVFVFVLCALITLLIGFLLKYQFDKSTVRLSKALRQLIDQQYDEPFVQEGVVEFDKLLDELNILASIQKEKRDKIETVMAMLPGSLDDKNSTLRECRDILHKLLERSSKDR